MKLLNRYVVAIRLIPFALLLGCGQVSSDTSAVPAPPLEANPSAVLFSCTFSNSPTDCGFEEQAKVPGRATLSNTGRDGGTAVRLHTEPGDSNVVFSGDLERNDLFLSQAASNGFEGQESWWAHSIMFPDDFAFPTWQMYVIFDFHNSGSGPFQANFHLNFDSNGGLIFRGYGGVNSGDGPFTAPVGPVTKNVWYDFVYHVRWSSGSDGFFDAWVNGVQKLAHRGPTLYAGQGVYLKLANYHTPVCNPYPGCTGPASSVIHDRIVRGTTWQAVSLTTLQGIASDVIPTPASTPTPIPIPDTQAPSVPTGLMGTAPSSSQIDLSWNPSTDDVGVAGYDVYLNNLKIAVTTATSFTHTGLGAGTTYNYRVSAHDAVPNYSAWTATPVSVTTPPAPDTQAPSIPAGLIGAALSSSQIKLSWNPSADNVGVTGYYVYLNDVALTKTTATSFTHSGLGAGTTYNYRVSAYDAVPNHSAWTATPVSVKTPARRVVRSDFNGDGKSDILWHNNATGQNLAWLMAGAAISFGGLIDTADLNWSIAGVGDFDGDSKSDILWRDGATGELAIWFMNGATISSRPVFGAVADLSWGIAGVGDFNGDGKSDILWHNSATGGNTIWLMNGATISDGAANFAMEPDLSWRISGVGDFDGDGKSDILWRHHATGEVSIWFMNGATILSRPVFGTVADLTWSIAGVGDFDGDARSDILWHNSATGSNTIWQMNGATISGGASDFASEPDLNWAIAGVGDFNGDGKSDVLWRNSVTGEDAIWLMNGTTILSKPAIATVTDLDWSIAGR